MHTLRRHRLAKGYSQTALARKLKVTQGCVARWESGASIPLPRMFPKIARAIGVDAMTLTQFVSPDPKPYAHASA